MKLDPNVWGPHYWFFLHTVSLTYPNRPNDVIKKKYYDLIMNFHLFIPTESASSNFNELLGLYPVTPYLDSRDAFIRWVYFIHNKMNKKLEKPQIKLSTFYENYYQQYKNKDISLKEYYKYINKYIYLAFIIILIAFIYYLYNK